MLTYKEMMLSGRFHGSNPKRYAAIKQHRAQETQLLVDEIQAQGALPVHGSNTAWVSRAGDVFSAMGGRFTKLRPGTKPGGYKFVHIHHGGLGRRCLMVHRLVAIAFIPNQNPGVLIEVNHLDGDKANNSAANLEWCTRRENAQHALRLGLMKTGSQHSNSKLSAEAVRSIRLLDGTCKRVGAQFGVSAQTICNIRLGRKYSDVV